MSMTDAYRIGRIGYAIKKFEQDREEALPPYVCGEDGKPLLAWRVLLLPYLGEEDLYQQIRLDEPWDSEWNRQFTAKTPDAFSGFFDSKTGGNTKFTVVMSQKGETPFSPVYFSQDRKSYNIPSRFDSSNTILVMESGSRSWTDPNHEFQLEELSKEEPEKSSDADGGNLSSDQYHAYTRSGILLVSKRCNPEKLVKRCLLDVKKEKEASEK